MVATYQQISQNLGVSVEAVARVKGCARWVCVGALLDGSDIIDHNNVTCKEEAMTTYMNVRGQLSVSHDNYCRASEEFMCRRSCAMSKFLRNTRAEQTTINYASSGRAQGTQRDNQDEAGAVCSSMKWRVSSRCAGRNRGTNRQRRKLSIACGFLFDPEQLKIKCFVKRAMSMTGLTRKYTKASMKKYAQNQARARRMSESNEVTKERTVGIVADGLFMVGFTMNVRSSS